jgi:hypothetical protein
MLILISIEKEPSPFLYYFLSYSPFLTNAFYCKKVKTDGQQYQ